MSQFLPKDVEFIFYSYINYEKSFLKYLDTVPYSEENKSSWSPEIISLFLNICGLIESISVKMLNIKTKRNLTIDDFESKIFKENNLINSRTFLYIYTIFPNCIIKPFDRYREAPDGWWYIYNKLKHNRLEHYERANLNNVIKSLASLFLLITNNKNDEEFTKALIRFGMLENGYVPECAHKQRLLSPIDWMNSEIFAVSDRSENLSSDNIDKIQVFNNRKLANFIGRMNPV